MVPPASQPATAASALSMNTARRSGRKSTACPPAATVCLGKAVSRRPVGCGLSMTPPWWRECRRAETRRHVPRRLPEPLLCSLSLAKGAVARLARLSMYERCGCSRMMLLQAEPAEVLGAPVRQSLVSGPSLFPVP
jgi:hypothetical protein